jgi:hypothetical protein
MLPKANAKDRQPRGEQFANYEDREAGCGRIAGTIGKKYPIGL